MHNLKNLKPIRLWRKGQWLSGITLSGLMILAITDGLWSDEQSQGQEQPQMASIQYYSQGETKISLQPIKKTLTYFLPLVGKTNQGSLLMQIQKTKGKSMQREIPLDKGQIETAYLFHQGPGQYQITIFGQKNPNGQSYQGIGQFYVQVTEPIPAQKSGLTLNRQIIEYVNSVMGKKIKRGECWDLAQEPLDLFGADWDRPTRFGKALDTKKDSILPGDIIQFRSVKLVSKLPNGGTRWETVGAPDHTAIIYEVLGPNHYRLAHQNVENKRHVVVTDMNLNNMTQGKFWLYRPMAGFVNLSQVINL